MIRTMRWAFLAAALLTTVVNGADLKKGLAAVERHDWAAALAEFRPLAEKGVLEAEVNLGNLYMKGLGVPEDYEAALRWFRKAAAQGNPVALGKLGLMHYYGFGVREDHAEAARWFRKAAGRDEPGAASVLATLYATGDGVEKDKTKAYYWYTVASERGHPTALETRNALVDEMSPGEINEALDLIADWHQRTEPPDRKLPPEHETVKVKPASGQMGKAPKSKPAKRHKAVKKAEKAKAVGNR